LETITVNRKTLIYLFCKLRFLPKNLPVYSNYLYTFRLTSYKRRRSDHLPYLLRNDVGANLKFFTTVTTDELRREPQWIYVNANENVSFTFPIKRFIYMVVMIIIIVTIL